MKVCSSLSNKNRGPVVLSGELIHEICVVSVLTINGGSSSIRFAVYET